MEFIIVIPAYNEEELIGQTIRSILQQSQLPKQLIVVNDGSTDRTEEIVQEFVDQYDWIKLVNNDKKEGHAPGAKVIKAFYLGFNTIDIPYDYIVKLDADLELPDNYFASISKMFENNPKLGIAGGTIVIEKNGDWVYENFSDEDHVKGAYKSYRRACFEAIGGPKLSVGWDTADELVARFLGWEVATNTSLQIKHFREMGTETGFVKVREKVGYGMYRLRYGFWITLISAIKAGYLNKPYVLTGLAVLYGFFKAFFRRDEFIVTKEEGAFIRKFRWKRSLGKVFG